MRAARVLELEVIDRPEAAALTLDPVKGEVGELWRRARKDEKRLATLSLDTVICFKSPGERAAFTGDLTSSITSRCARYHDEGAPGARPHRLIVASYPAPGKPQS